jgi:hypothetical protein
MKLGLMNRSLPLSTMPNIVRAVGEQADIIAYILNLK